jgi:ankyrin repeat protein
MGIWEIIKFVFFPETVRELLTHVPAGLKSELPASPSHAIAIDLAAESELSPLHMAAYSGSENVVRALLNSSGVQVDAASVPSVRDRETLYLH